MKQFFTLFVLLIFSSLSTSAVDIGQRFIFSLPHTTNIKELKNWMAKTKPAGVLLETGHLKNRTQAKKLISQLQTIAKKLGLPPLLVSVDWEGGIVSRPNEEGGFVSIPSPHALAQAGRSSCFLAGKLVGQQLRDVGVNMNFAPSLDLFDPDNYILATRCFSDDPAKTAEYALAFAHGLQSESVLPVAKHFPGLGLGNHDTHLASVQLQFDEKTFAHHATPFKQTLREGMPCIMASHAQCAQFGKEPITHSKHAVRYLKSLNPNALIITDDFGVMKAALNNLKTDEAILKGIHAGYHLLIFSGTMQNQIQLIGRLQTKIDTIPDDVLAACEERNKEIVMFKQKQCKKNTAPLALDEEKTAHFLAQQCISAPCNTIKPESVLLSANIARIRPSDPWYVQNNQTYLGQHLTKTKEYILDPKDQNSVKKLQEQLKSISPKTPLILQTLFYGQGVWNDTQEQWLKVLKPYQKNLTVISLGHPYEKKMVPQATVIELGSFHKPLIDQAIKQLTQKQLLTGADRLLKDPKKFLQNKRFGLVCHQCSLVTVGSKKKFLPDMLAAWAKQQKNKTKLAALFSPEHGLQGNKEAFAFIDSEKDSRWGCPVHSLHGAHKSPTPNMLEGLDLLLIDLQEVGVRCYTYLSTMHLILEAAAKQKLPVLVLDRPNPLYYLPASGPRLEKEHVSFLGKINTPFVHGKTMGKLALEANKTIGAQLSILGCVGDECAQASFLKILHQTPPSPNLASLDAIRSYPMTVFIEGTNYSEGRGTNHPFEQIGAPWVNKKQLAAMLNSKKLVGVYFEPISFLPQTIQGKAEKPKHKDALCQGVFVHVTHPEQVDPTNIGKTILETLFDLYPQQSSWIKYGNRYALDLLAGTSSWRETIG